MIAVWLLPAFLAGRPMPRYITPMCLAALNVQYCTSNSRTAHPHIVARTRTAGERVPRGSRSSVGAICDASRGGKPPRAGSRRLTNATTQSAGSRSPRRACSAIGAWHWPSSFFEIGEPWPIMDCARAKSQTSAPSTAVVVAFVDSSAAVCEGPCRGGVGAWATGLPSRQRVRGRRRVRR